MAGSRQDLDDTEITLTTGKLLGAFFGLVLVCALFFTMGYLVGHANSASDKTEIVGAAPSNGTNATKPPAGNKTAVQASPTPSAPVAVPAVQPQPTSASSTTAKPPDASYVSASAPDVKTSSSGPYTVQVAAVSKQEDAQSLVSALQKKQYPVFMTSVPGDSLFHVQVGPYNDPKDAEAMRSRLAAEGYDAIVKK
jgi:cell division septation protein DedD